MFPKSLVAIPFPLSSISTRMESLSSINLISIIPFGLSIYGLAIDDLGIGSGEKIFALDELDYLYVLQETNKSLGRLTSLGFAGEELVWKSDEVYGGSNNYFENIDKKNPDDREIIRCLIINVC